MPPHEDVEANEENALSKFSLSVAEETTLVHARQFAGQNEDNWIISEELLSLLAEDVMEGNLSLWAVGLGLDDFDLTDVLPVNLPF